jgi:hypothetical protein
MQDSTADKKEENISKEDQKKKLLVTAVNTLNHCVSPTEQKECLKIIENIAKEMRNQEESSIYLTFSIPKRDFFQQLKAKEPNIKKYFSAVSSRSENFSNQIECRSSLQNQNSIRSSKENDKCPTEINSNSQNFSKNKTSSNTFSSTSSSIFKNKFKSKPEISENSEKKKDIVSSDKSPESKLFDNKEKVTSFFESSKNKINEKDTVDDRATVSFGTMSFVNNTLFGNDEKTFQFEKLKTFDTLHF